MDEKLKMDAKLNRCCMAINFWLSVTNKALKVAKFASDKATKMVNKYDGLSAQLTKIPSDK